MKRPISPVVLNLVLTTITCLAKLDLDEVQTAFLEAHNKARAEADLGDLKWDMDLVDDATKLASKCQLTVSDKHAYGVNFADSTDKNPNTATLAKSHVQKWLEQKKHKSGTSWSCITSTPSCKEYSQVMWRATTNVGCVTKTCSKYPSLTVCEYYPKGNIAGETPY